MTIKELVWDMRILLRQLTDDSSVNDAHLIHKLNIYRALYIVEQYNMGYRLEEEWFQRLPLTECTPVNSGDDPNVPYTSINFGKFTLPRVIELPGGVSLKLRTSSMALEIYWKNMSELMQMIKSKDYRVKIFKFYTRIGNEFYIYPYTEKIATQAILFNPLDGYQFDTEYGDLANLNAGYEYKVVKGSITQSNPATEPPTLTVYAKEETFTSNASYTYSGTGKVKLTDQVLAVNGDYEYPISPDIAQRIIIDILTKDFQIERSQIFDVINDSIDQLKLIYSGLSGTRK